MHICLYAWMYVGTSSAAGNRQSKGRSSSATRPTHIHGNQLKKRTEVDVDSDGIMHTFIQLHNYIHLIYTYMYICHPLF